jgi:hypothetical protein
MRVDDVAGNGLGRYCSHVIGCDLTQEARVQNAFDDVAGDIWQAWCKLGANGDGDGVRPGARD